MAFKILVNEGSTFTNKLHAECDALRYARPGDELEVLRWNIDGTPKASKPCSGCLEKIRSLGIVKIYYHDSAGRRVRERIHVRDVHR